MKCKTCANVFGSQWATAQVVDTNVGKGATEKVRVQTTNLEVPVEMKHGYQHTIFKDPSLKPTKKLQKIVYQFQIGQLPARGGAAVSTDDLAVNLYPSDPEVSEAQDQADESKNPGCDSVAARLAC